MNTSLPFDETVSTLHNILENLYQYGGPILIVLGTISSLMNLAVLFQKNFRKIPCTIYFIARNISNLFFIYLSLFYVTLVVGYQIYPSASNLSYCHFSIYISLLCDILSPFYLILVAIDRLLITTTKTNLKRRITHRFVCILLICGTLFWILFHVHALIYSEIIEIQSNPFHCDLQVGLYSTIITYYSLIIKGILIPFILLTFGFIILKNLRHTTRRTPSNVEMRKTVSENDQQLIMMLIKDILIYLIFASLLSIILMYELITQHHTKDFHQQEIEYFIRHLSTFCGSIPFCIGSYTNFIVSKTYRKEVKHILLCNSLNFIQ